MSEWIQQLDREYEKLKTRRDELRVQLNLGKKEVEDAWNEGEIKLHELEEKIRIAQRISRETASEASDVARQGAAATLAEARATSEKLMTELREGFEKFRKLI